MTREPVWAQKLKTPIYLCEETRLKENLALLGAVKQRTGCKIILALKACSMFSLFPLMKNTLDGVTASSLNEARLGFEEFGKEVHLCAPAYRDEEIAAFCQYSQHITFNSFAQWARHRDFVLGHANKISCGLRINPEQSTAPAAIYDPCGANSRMGITQANFTGQDLAGISGLHFHALCQQNASALAQVLAAVEEKFGAYLSQMQWLNLGGGHHITRADYDVDLLCDLIIGLKKRYGLEVILEPGEAVALNAGVLVASVLDVVQNGLEIAILDTSAATHMPDVLEMPYRPEISGAGLAGQYSFTYRLAGNTCLAGDIIGDYSFPAPLEIGSRLVFQDMLHYTMVKNNTFNGVNLPDIGLLVDQEYVRLIREFNYADYKGRLS